MKYLTKNDRTESQVTLKNYLNIANRNLLAMVQATWIVLLPAQAHMPHLSGSGTVKCIRNRAKEEEVFFQEVYVSQA